MMGLQYFNKTLRQLNDFCISKKGIVFFKSIYGAINERF